MTRWRRIGLVVSAGRPIAIGAVTAGATSQLALWALNGAVWERVVVDSPPAGFDLIISDALVDRDGSLLIGGIFRHQAVVWSVDVPVTD